MLIRRPTGGAGKLAPEEPAARDESAAKDCPALVEFLTCRTWEDGARRETGTVMLLAEHGVFKLWLNDRDADRSLWISGGSVLDLVGRAEEILASGAGEWRMGREKKRKA